ncbi:MAG: hypothetical protein HRU25_04655 [Psychrobium sp.]|nr:hypothetical protein [Psychrobium sp.]
MKTVVVLGGYGNFGKRIVENLAYHLIRLWLGDYSLTYPDITVEEEVRSVLTQADHFALKFVDMVNHDYA